jgi:hypothetical protein
MNDPIIQRSVGLKQSRWLWLDDLARSSGSSTSQLLRDVIESFVLNSVCPAERCHASTEQRDDNEAAGGGSYSPAAGASPHEST